MKNVIEYDIKTTSSQKGYMHGFQGFANVIKKINTKLSKNKFESNLDSWAVDVDYNSTIPIVEQIGTNVISAINRIQGPILNLMRLYGMQDISLFCGTIEKVSDICSIYQTMSKENFMKIGEVQISDFPHQKNEEEMMERLTNLALDFNAGNGNEMNNDDKESIHPNIVINDILKNDKVHVEEFDCENFFNIISSDFRKNNVGNMLCYMSEAMNINFERQKVKGSISSLQKVQSLQGRWFSVKKKNVEKIVTGDSIERNCIFLKNKRYYRVLSVFKKTYNKWRHERRGERKEKMKVHLQELADFHNRFGAHEAYN